MAHRLIRSIRTSPTRDPVAAGRAARLPVQRSLEDMTKIQELFELRVTRALGGLVLAAQRRHRAF
ncbi:hypothetical protein [Azospirillum sp.]|uniref:hypothetical protein n=1 Tax=Azospirillum sp. TaxID=34012 RepID=UPI0026078B2C|nr:hypothetical protein [Azospirillum sp.]